MQFYHLIEVLPGGWMLSHDFDYYWEAVEAMWRFCSPLNRCFIQTALLCGGIGKVESEEVYEKGWCLD